MNVIVMLPLLLFAGAVLVLLKPDTRLNWPARGPG
jgi:hypothetical protein